MRILFTTHQFFPESHAGVEIVTLGLARELRARGHEPFVLAAKRTVPHSDLLPGETERSLDDIVAATDRGIVVKNRGSWSIDQQRYNFQFSGQVAYEVKAGKITGMLKDFAYQSRTPDFWNSMDMLGGKSSYWLGGSFTDGKGEPSQASSVSHGCPPARFKNVNIVNTGRRA